MAFKDDKDLDNDLDKAIRWTTVYSAFLAAQASSIASLAHAGPTWWEYAVSMAIVVADTAEAAFTRVLAERDKK